MKTISFLLNSVTHVSQHLKQFPRTIFRTEIKRFTCAMRELNKRKKKQKKTKHNQLSNII